jgi:hypothetical protein
MKKDTPIPLSSIMPRWLKGGGSYVSSANLEDVSSVGVVQSSMGTSKFANATEKYCHVRSIALRLADVVAKHGEDHCLQVCEELEKITLLIMSGAIPEICRIDEVNEDSAKDNDQSKRDNPIQSTFAVDTVAMDTDQDEVDHSLVFLDTDVDQDDERNGVPSVPAAKEDGIQENRDL